MTVSSDDKTRRDAPVDFSALVLGFSSAALYYLAETALDGRVSPTKNLPLARQNIDILIMLRDKTKGNLSSDEESLMTQLVSDLQIKLIDAER